jgi:hypothetical protein
LLRERIEQLAIWDAAYALFRPSQDALP